MKQKRDTFISIRLNQEEIGSIKNRMSTLNMTSRSNYIRLMALNGFIVERDDTKLNVLLHQYELLKGELNVIGTNINQIAKRLNSGDSVYKDDIEDIRNNFENFTKCAEENLNKIVKDY